MIKMPPNILQVFSGFNDIVNLKIIDTKYVVEWLANAIMPKSTDALQN
jgi:hypothetical protein